ncbi:uDP-N-acetylglucosamine--N-acetylmuramyl-(pentapeptide) pyrophosphoryl-undecaprenol N-acetylglucosamine transferase [Dialister sp. CAG:588]|nr:uDP-N-acetylglucosamine--N-acetylmuramyl-(pentapeptide) pyrophosphoryl-undecaprenol N-acetylglucosamine transferase [Dialister sp. CAG:588]
MKKIILSGGGTGGHIYPAVTIAKAFQEKESITGKRTCRNIICRNT